MPRGSKALTGLAVTTVLAVVLLYMGFVWTVNRVYVHEGESLMLRYKGPLIFGKRERAKTGYWAEEGQIGVLAKLRGPGRHFYCPIWWERTKVPDVVIKPGEVGMVTCKLGDNLPPSEFLVDGDIGDTKFKGILRKVLHPGRYRINPYGYEAETVQLQTFTSGNTEKKAGWVEIPTGYVGVVTNLAANPLTGAKAGIADDVLPPGIYPINGREQNIDIVEIGYRLLATLPLLVTFSPLRRIVRMPTPCYRSSERRLYATVSDARTTPAKCFGIELKSMTIASCSRSAPSRKEIFPPYRIAKGTGTQRNVAPSYSVTKQDVS